MKHESRDYGEKMPEIKIENEETNVPNLSESDVVKQEESSFECEFCFATYPNEVSWKRHIKIAHSTSKVKCKICHREIVKKFFKRHMKKNHLTDPSQNIQVKKSDEEINDIAEGKSKKEEIINQESVKSCEVMCKVEMKELDPEVDKNEELCYGNVECNICKQTYSSSHNLKKHMYNVHRMVRVKCDICDKEVNKKSLDRHMKSVHSAKVSIKKKRNLVPDEEKIPCILCDKKCSNLISLQNHMKNIHEAEQFKCPQCDFQGTRKQLEKHMKKQHNNEVYQCTRCQKVLKSKSTLREHMWIHTDHRRFICDICGMRFKRTSNYHGHLKSHQEKKFQCQLCGNFFLRKRYLAIHEQIIHNYYGEGVPPQEKGFQCEVCGIKLKWKNNLLGHMRIHTGEKPYKCKICGEDFTCHGSLRTHMSKHAICSSPSVVSSMFIQQAYLDNRAEPTAPFAPSAFSSTNESTVLNKM